MAIITVASVSEEEYIPNDLRRRSKVDLFRDIVVFRNRASALGVLLLTLVCSAHSQTLQGDWQGTLAAPNGSLPLVFHLGSQGSGTVDSPAQQFSAPLQYSTTGNQVTITVPSVNGTYAATVNGSRMNGTWTQNGQNTPLTLTKGGAQVPNGDGGGG